jgi:hypothetical protein
MAHREYVDSHGLKWQAWEVIPLSSERRKLRERRFAPRDSNDRRKRHEARLRASNGEAEGWLVFESVDGKRRLKPIPREWYKASTEELESMCARAARASRPSRRLIE